MSQQELQVHKFETGAVRGTDATGTRYDLINHVGMRRLAEAYAEGAKKYSDWNWQKGMPASDLINHALRHLFLWLAGDRTDDHIGHAIWNLWTLAYFEELRPELIDIPSRKMENE